MSRPRLLRLITFFTFSAILAFVGCRDAGLPQVLVTAKLGTAELQGQIFALRVSVEGGTLNATRDYRRNDGLPITFPSSFSFSIEKTYGGIVDVSVQGLDAVGRALAQAELKSLPLQTGKTLQKEIFLNCFGKCPIPNVDGGVIGDAAEKPVVMVNCGNGRMDPGETCDTEIASGQPGACPTNECNDGLSCTLDLKMGTGCTVECMHQEITLAVPGDGCCPANSSHETDEDCSSTCGNGAVDSQESCDKGIGEGAPGSCPSMKTCNDQDPCTADRLISAATCSARCTNQAIVAAVSGDSCCPNNATNALDKDCKVVCGDALLDSTEKCDTAIAAGKPGACPLTCDDALECTSDVIVGVACQQVCVHRDLDSSGTVDGCCPSNATASADPDCASVCGNGVVESSETCDKRIPANMPGACPTVCAPFGCQALSLKGSADLCTATCEVASVALCVASVSDGCCSAGCTPATDIDCPKTCGNGLLENGETCDRSIAAPAIGACPTTCDDNDPCTEDRWDSKGSCLDRCVHRPVTAFKSGDSCCPVGSNQNVDADCKSVCGDGVVEAKETCDRAIPAGSPGACPVSCQSTEPCSKKTLQGKSNDCTATCVASVVSTCGATDGCCPAKCGSSEDADCPIVCGNGVLEIGEFCDKGLTSGFPGSCPSTCEVSESCTASTATGSVNNCTRRCTVTRNRSCGSGDGCCPVGCSFRTDLDCAPICGNGVVEDGETCDPPSSCPTACKADADLCTAAKLLGDPAMCTARCSQIAIRECGSASDLCCPTGCGQMATDPDCKPPKTLAPNMTPAL
jgi:hypothetical protein